MHMQKYQGQRAIGLVWKDKSGSGQTDMLPSFLIYLLPLLMRSVNIYDIERFLHFDASNLPRDATVILRWIELEDFVSAQFYWSHALADDNQCIRIREKMLEFPQQCYLRCLHTINPPVLNWSCRLPR